jgi:Domain of unknown function (DUF4399)
MDLAERGLAQGEQKMDLCRGGVISLFAAVALVLAATCGASAEEKLKGGPTPSPPGASVHFLELKDGATVPTKVTIRFGLSEMGVAPAGSDRPNSGHHHLLIDTELPPLDQPIPNDFNHLHFGAGQTEAEVTLKPGPHTLQLLLGDKDHIPHNPPVMSPRIRVVASDATASPEAAAAPVKKRRAQVSKRYRSSAAYRRYQYQRSRSY